MKSNSASKFRQVNDRIDVLGSSEEEREYDRLIASILDGIPDDTQRQMISVTLDALGDFISEFGDAAAEGLIAEYHNPIGPVSNQFEMWFREKINNGEYEYESQES